ncbi:DNA methyltransferase [Acinetobacter baumannii]|uniref:DNA methyltransferase n=1 Tax=Acinetobacter baumannii TaxID=470 RepID=UPI0024DF00EC|nr:DNA methyltransferase [Acinetobacter baumannii]MDK2129282.1 DNA methyltransferase [Acinetobacter baumannii]MDK2159977.1 DNA methyltransferase [Acinetobacter baumannii]MDK2167615.1 DNA methyltransferase [Acinetobacter baumannii]MDK2251013.1 DNA methyltransferase [Acinetobacter baumannii]MDK2262397.1 DNA methyltransferase [Acinetobacter baumannii]
MSFDLDYEKLNVSYKSKTSRFPWRGQFSPEFIDYLIATVFPDSEVIYDPFCGSGTVLYEASMKGKRSFGSELNPAAWCLSNTLLLNSLNNVERNELLEKLEEIFSNITTPYELISVVKNLEDSPLRITLYSILLLGTGNSKVYELDKITKAYNFLQKFIESIEIYEGESFCYLEDSRKSSLLDESVDGIITSPPYINVFNYHQNYRPIMEDLGWKPLSVATSEIGANRKFRQNRFKTVVQYALDMSLSLNEMERVLKLGSYIVLVVGRESKILGERFRNSEIILDLIKNHQSFKIVQTNYRSFNNKFGQNIIEDILIVKKVSKNFSVTLDVAREIGKKSLLQGLGTVDVKNKDLLLLALNASDTIQPSDIYEL